MRMSQRELAGLDVHLPVRVFKPEFLNKSQTAGLISFDYQWLSEISSKPENVSLFSFMGPSMNPTILDGDLAMIDHGRNKVYSGCLYLIKIDDNLSVARLIVQPGNSLLIIRDNKEVCPPFEIPLEGVEVIGRVIWTSRLM